MISFSDAERQAALNQCIIHTHLPTMEKPYRGKVRDVYELTDHKIGIVVTDRISAFDHIMRQAIPFKGQILNRLSAFSFEMVEDIVQTHVIDVPHPNVTIARKCDPIPVEVVIRACLTGHAWRTYKSGKRTLCGVDLPGGMTEHQKFEQPILTPATKAQEGHDEDISEHEILEQNIVSASLWEQIRETAFKLFDRGSKIASDRGLILVDTKYEFGLYEDRLVLIDEVHTTDSSRYFHAEGYEQRLKDRKPQKQLSKEFLREWLIEQGFQGLDGQKLPDLPDSFRWSVFQRYAELFEILTGEAFEPHPLEDFNQTLEQVFTGYLE